MRAYLDHDLVMEALRAAGADAVWPGWGFVAEDPAFADRVVAAGLCFLGPSGDAMRALGDKIAAKQLAEAGGIPVTPWSGGVVADARAAARPAARLGYPLVVKAAAGGGGRGIRVVEAPAALEAAFRSAEAEARAAFGDGRLFLERHVSGARHVEVQIAADEHGHVLALGARDCSVQRRHQKLIEEAPPPGCRGARSRGCPTRRRASRSGSATSGSARSSSWSRATTLHLPRDEPAAPGRARHHRGGHGLDLVALQVRIARGESIAGLAVGERGVAIEARVCAEDPEAASPPRRAASPASTPRSAPASASIRGGRRAASSRRTFDSLIAKVIATGRRATRPARASCARSATSTSSSRAARATRAS